MPISLPAASERLSDSELVVRAQAGESNAREELARRLRPPAYRLALQLLGRTDDAKDVAQDAMLRFFDTLSRVEAHRPVLPWVFRIVRNRVIDLHRRRQRRNLRSLDGELAEVGFELVSAGPDPEAEVRRLELQEMIWNCLGRLSARHREILVLRDYQDLSYAEIAGVLAIPVGTVMSRLHAARAKLRKLLIERGWQQEDRDETEARGRNR